MAYQTYIDATIDALRPSQFAVDPDATTRACNHLKRRLDSHYKRAYAHYPYVRDSFMSAFGPDSPITRTAQGVFRMSKAAYKSVRANDAARTMTRNVNQTVITFAFVQERFKWLQVNGLLIDDISIVMLCTGCRRTELIHPITDDGTFVEFAAYGPSHIQQMGLAKKTPNCTRTFVIKPCIFLSSDEVIALINKIRAVVGRPVARDNGVLAKKMELLAKTAFPQFVGNGFAVGSHVYRAIYADIAYRRFGAPNQSQMSFVADVLGHEGFPSVPNYLHVRIVFDGDDPEFFQEAARQLADSFDTIKKVPVQRPDGTEVMVLSVPRRRLDASERERLTQNKLDELALEGVVPNRTTMRELCLI